MILHSLEAVGAVALYDNDFVFAIIGRSGASQRMRPACLLEHVLR